MIYVDGANPEVIRELKARIGGILRLLRVADRRADLGFAQQQQLTDNTCQLPKEAQTDVRMDIHAYVEEIHQNISFVAETDCFPSTHCSYS